MKEVIITLFCYRETTINHLFYYCKDRRPIEPPPILQLHWENCSDEELK